MEKKNPYIMMIGFKKEDPDHAYVAELLNSMGRGKAQYIVKAILAYQNRKQSGDVLQPARVTFDYDAIKRVVLQVIEEKEAQVDAEQEVVTEKEKNDLLQDFDENALIGIMKCLEAFQEQ